MFVASPLISKQRSGWSENHVNVTVDFIICCSGSPLGNTPDAEVGRSQVFQSCEQVPKAFIKPVQFFSQVTVDIPG